MAGYFAEGLSFPPVTSMNCHPSLIWADAPYINPTTSTGACRWLELADTNLQFVLQLKSLKTILTF